MRKLFLLMVCAGLFVCCPKAYTQAIVKAGKAACTLVKKTPKKVVPNKTKVKTTPQYRPRPRTSYVDCEKCNGKGKVSVWNSYYQCYQTKTCSRCSGTGKVKSN